jgi:hypothetical protein
MGQSARVNPDSNQWTQAPAASEGISGAASKRSQAATRRGRGEAIVSWTTVLP